MRYPHKYFTKNVKKEEFRWNRAWRFLFFLCMQKYMFVYSFSKMIIVLLVCGFDYQDHRENDNFSLIFEIPNSNYYTVRYLYKASITKSKSNYYIPENIWSVMWISILKQRLITVKIMKCCIKPYHIQKPEWSFKCSKV